MMKFGKKMMQNQKSLLNYSAIILAAGESSRMGSSKSFLKYNEHELFIQHIISEYYNFGCNSIIVVTNAMDAKWFIDNSNILPKNLFILINHHPEWHRFYSLKLAAKEAIKNDYVFVHNVDNPFVNVNVLIELMANRQDTDYIIPTYKGKGGHPILISQKVIQDIASEKEDQLHLKDFLNKFTKKRVEVDDDNILVNINDVDDYRKFIK